MTQAVGPGTWRRGTGVRGGAVMLMALALSLGGCRTALRAPVCAEGEFEFPPGAAGFYRLALPTSSLEWSGAFAEISGIEFEIRDLPDRYEMATSRRHAASLGRALAATRRHARLGRAGPAPRDDQGHEPADPPADATPVMPIAVCRIGDAWYTQSDVGDGTWTLARFDLSPTGISTVDLAFAPDDLKTHGIPWLTLPKGAAVDARGRWTFDMLEAVQLIVDNRALTSPEDRVRLLAAGKATSIGIVFSRIERPAGRGDGGGAGGADVVFRLPKPLSSGQPEPQ